MEKSVEFFQATGVSRKIAFAPGRCVAVYAPGLRGPSLSGATGSTLLNNGIVAEPDARGDDFFPVSPPGPRTGR